MKDIQTGDRVHVWFTSTRPGFQGVVRRIAQSTGDCWIIEAASGALHYVQTFAEIVKWPNDNPS